MKVYKTPLDDAITGKPNQEKNEVTKLFDLGIDILLSTGHRINIGEGPEGTLEIRVVTGAINIVPSSGNAIFIDGVDDDPHP